MSDVVEAATAPYQYVLSTRAGTECIAHILQTLTDDNLRTTVLSIDGMGAFEFYLPKVDVGSIDEGGGWSRHRAIRQTVLQATFHAFVGVMTEPYTTSNRAKGASKGTC